ncbi:hypothetical protein B0H10DRAFT_2208600 [Mycena sp. CBHHK59/15]|nr:hypothetical protein B0H10DRAFT_2208600 [Mycena sp. CBHHK59/15]
MALAKYARVCIARERRRFCVTDADTRSPPRCPTCDLRQLAARVPRAPPADSGVYRTLRPSRVSCRVDIVVRSVAAQVATRLVPRKTSNWVRRTAEWTRRDPCPVPRCRGLASAADSTPRAFSLSHGRRGLERSGAPVPTTAGRRNLLAGIRGATVVGTTRWRSCQVLRALRGPMSGSVQSRTERTHLQECECGVPSSPSIWRVSGACALVVLPRTQSSGALPRRLRCAVPVSAGDPGAVALPGALHSGDRVHVVLCSHPHRRALVGVGLDMRRRAHWGSASRRRRVDPSRAPGASRVRSNSQPTSRRTMSNSVRRRAQCTHPGSSYKQKHATLADSDDSRVGGGAGREVAARGAVRAPCGWRASRGQWRVGCEARASYLKL